MLVTLFGKIIIPVILGGTKTIAVFALLYSIPSCELYAVLPASTFIAVRLVQPEKASFPMLVTLFGIVTPVRFLQLEKAELPILVTLLGIITPIRLSQ